MRFGSTLNSLSADERSSLQANLRAYKYVGPNKSLLERLCLDSLWEWVAGNLYPRWLAPNLITCEWQAARGPNDPHNQLGRTCPSVHPCPSVLFFYQGFWALQSLPRVCLEFVPDILHSPGSDYFGFAVLFVLLPRPSSVLALLLLSAARHQVTGFLFAFAGVSLVVYHSPGLDGQCPPWALATTSLCMFIYQTLDGSDGKQARQTKSGTPLGELFDHGVDAVVTTFYVLVITELLGIGTQSFDFIVVGVLMMMGFWVSNLVLIHTGRQQYQDMDAQEAQATIYLTCLALAAYGSRDPMAWRLPFPSAAMQAFALLPEVVTGRPGAAGVAGTDFDPALGGMTVRRFMVFASSTSMVISLLTNVANLVKFYLALNGRTQGDGGDKDDLQQLRKVGRGLGNLCFQMFTISLFAALTVTSWHLAISENQSQEGSGDHLTFLLFWSASAVSFGDIVAHLLVMRTSQVSRGDEKS